MAHTSHPTPRTPHLSHTPHLAPHSLSGMRPPPQDWLGIVSIVGARRTLRPDVLAIYDCNLKPEVLAGLLRAQPLSVISIRRCHSLSGSETLDTLPTGGTVRALMYAGLYLL